MKKRVNRIIGLMLTAVMTTVLAFANTNDKHVNFVQSVIVNGTLVEKGTYRVIFDELTGELSITKGKEVVAKAPARLEKLPENSAAVYTTRTEAGVDVLLSVTMEDDNRAVIMSSANDIGGPER